MELFDFSQYQQDQSDAVVQVLQERSALDPILTWLAEVSSGAETEIEKHPSDRSLVACGAGCRTCCVVNVSTLLPEGMAIVRYLRSQGEARVTLAAERLERLWREVGGLDDDERLVVRRPCAFLDEKGCCSIYLVRPLLCRSVTSTSADDCREALAGKVLGEEKTILMHQFQQDLYMTLFEAIGDGLEMCGLDGRSFQLVGLVRYLLKHPEAEQRWLDGWRMTWQELSCLGLN